MLLSDKAKLELLSDIDVRAPAPAGGTRRVSQTRTGLLWCRRACRRSRRVASPPDATARSARRSPMARTRSSAHGLTAHAAWHRSHTTHIHVFEFCCASEKCKKNRPFFFFNVKFFFKSKCSKSLRSGILLPSCHLACTRFSRQALSITIFSVQPWYACRPPLFGAAPSSIFLCVSERRQSEASAAQQRRCAVGGPHSHIARPRQPSRAARPPTRVLRYFHKHTSRRHGGRRHAVCTRPEALSAHPPSPPAASAPAATGVARRDADQVRDQVEPRQGPRIPLEPAVGARVAAQWRRAAVGLSDGDADRPV